MTTPTDTPPQTDPAVAHTTPDELLERQHELSDQLDAFHDDLGVECQSAVTAMHGQVLLLHQRLVELTARHHDAKSNLDADANGHSTWQSVRAYQNAVSQFVVAGLQDYLQSTRPDERIHAAARRCLANTTERLSTLPPIVDLPDVTSIYQVISSDTPLDRIRKTFERASRRVQKFARRLRSFVSRRPLPSLDARQVDVGYLARYHVQVRLARMLERHHEHAQQAIGAALSKIEDALAKWFLEQLAIEHTLDRIEFHRPRGAPVVDSHSVQEDTGDETDHTTTARDLAQRARTSSERLAAALDEAVGCLTDVAFGIQVDLDTARSDFDLDMGQAGTFLLRHRERRVPPASRTAGASLDRSATRWRVWYEKVSGRLHAIDCTLGLRDDLIEIENRLLTRLFDATLSPIYDAFRRMKSGLEQAIEDTEAACSAHTADQSFMVLARKLQSVQRKTLDRLRKTFRDVPGIVPANEALTDPGRGEWDEMLALIADLPRKVTVHRVRDESERDRRLGLPAPSFVINLRGIASDAIDPPLPDQLGAAAVPLMQRIVHVWDGAAKIEDIVQFNLGATLDELAAGASDDSTATDELPVVERGRQLAIEALRRSVDSLDDLSASLTEPWRDLEQAVFDSYQDDWADVQRRIRSEGAVEERLVGLRTRTTRSAERLWAGTKAVKHSVVHRARLLSANVVRSARRWIARGQAVVGAKEVAEDEAIQTLDAIVDLPTMQARLPLVYRKLFSFEPLTESALLEGRTRDLVRVRKHFERWRTRHDAGVLVLTSRLGDGRTTFLNVLREKVFANTDVRFGSIDYRIRSPAALAAYLAKLMDLDLPDGGGLPELRERFSTAESRDKPLVCMLDNLEHIVLQGTGTNELIEEALMFFSRTDRHVYWVATIGYEAWRFITKTTGSATGFVTHHALTTIDRATLEDLIFTRHRRSGIPVVFAAPTTPSPLLRQRLRRARTEEKKQAILRKDYFDALHAATEQDIRLALFYWIRSSDFETRSDEVLIRPFEPLAFRFLNGLDQIRSFTLKAFVVHNTLTLEEHRSIFRLPEDESVFVLESLLNERLIEVAAADGESRYVDSSVVPGRTYRIRRLALNPVIKHLRDKHFIY